MLQIVVTLPLYDLTLSPKTALRRLCMLLGLSWAYVVVHFPTNACSAEE